MQSDHQMARMGQSERPVPRFQIVHKPQHLLTGTNPQPWHTRIIGGNGEPMFTSENYVDVSSAYDVIRALARLFGLNADIEGDVDDAPHLIAESARGHVAVPVMRVEVGP
jgi:hypothetical protein